MLMVSTSGYYAWLNRPVSQREQENRRLSNNIIDIFQASKKCYGSVRIHRQLLKQGELIGRNRVIRLMQKNKLKAVSAVNTQLLRHD